MKYDADYYLECTPAAQARIRQLAVYWSTEGRSLPKQLPQDPYDAPEGVRGIMIGLQLMLTPGQWMYLRDAVEALQKHHTFEDWRRAEVEAARAEAAEQRRIEHERLAAVKAALAQRPFSITQATLDAIAPREEQEPLREHIRAFAREWFSSRSARVEGQLPDDAQLDVITHLEGHLLVSARAGSGKTRALTHRALFLQEETGVSGDAMLVLAFNRKAAKEVASRLTRYGCHVPHVMTFHALAVALERPHAELVTDDEDDAGNSRMRELLNGIVADLERDPARAAALADLMLDLTQPETIDLEWFSQFAWRALDGTLVESFAHKLLLDFLIEHGITPEYRPWVGNAERGRRQAFVLFEWRGETIELVMASERDRFDPVHVRRGPEVRLIELPDVTDTTRTAMFGAWTSRFHANGIRPTRLTRSELWARIAHIWRTEFVALTTSYVLRMRNSGRDTDNRRAWVKSYSPSDALEGRFLALAELVAQRYEDAIARGDYTDFQEVLLRACRRVEAGGTAWQRATGPGDIRRLRHVMVDEFQDVSPLFMRLLVALRNANPAIQFMGVGDDWQAINGFAGATTHYFHEFARYFPGATRLNLLTNHRSAAEVVELGNDIMVEQGAAATARREDAGQLLHADRRTLPLLPEERSLPGGAHVAAVRRLVAKEAKPGRSVVLLSRVREPFYGVGPDWMKAVLTDLPIPATAEVSGSTIHSFKGKEASVAILLDGTDRRFPTISPLWFLLRIFGDTLESLTEDERRLLYVATSRSADTLYVMSDLKGLSVLFEDGTYRLRALDWRAYPPPSADGAESMTLVLTNLDPGYQERTGTAPVKDALKKAGFAYSAQPQPHWTKAIEGGASDLAAIVEAQRQSAWSREATRVLAEFRDASGTVVGSFIVMGRVWTQFGAPASATDAEDEDDAFVGELVRRTLPLPLMTRLAGVTFANDDGSSRQQIIARFCFVGQGLTLVRQPRNPYDRNAIAVCVPAFGVLWQIGFVASELASLLAAALDAGEAISGTIVEISGGGVYALGVTIRLSR